jgi:hypothetical protein
LHKINEKSYAGINGYFYIKNPLLFHKLLCEEMIFPLFKGKNDGLRYKVINAPFLYMWAVRDY